MLVCCIRTTKRYITEAYHKEIYVGSYRLVGGEAAGPFGPSPWTRGATNTLFFKLKKVYLVSKNVEIPFNGLVDRLLLASNRYSIAFIG
jgi:hypothetical protein